MSVNDESGKVTIVEIVAPDGTLKAYLIELAWNGETLTISEQAHTLTDELREAAERLAEQVRSHYGTNTTRSGRGPTEHPRLAD